MGVGWGMRAVVLGASGRGGRTFAWNFFFVMKLPAGLYFTTTTNLLKFLPLEFVKMNSFAAAPISVVSFQTT